MLYRAPSNIALTRLAGVFVQATQSYTRNLLWGPRPSGRANEPCLCPVTYPGAVLWFELFAGWHYQGCQQQRDGAV